MACGLAMATSYRHVIDFLTMAAMLGHAHSACQLPGRAQQQFSLAGKPLELMDLHRMREVMNSGPGVRRLPL